MNLVWQSVASWCQHQEQLVWLAMEAQWRAQTVHPSLLILSLTTSVRKMYYGWIITSYVQFSCVLRVNKCLGKILQLGPHSRGGENECPKLRKTSFLVAFPASSVSYFSPVVFSPCSSSPISVAAFPPFHCHVRPHHASSIFPLWHEPQHKRHSHGTCCGTSPCGCRTR